MLGGGGQWWGQAGGVQVLEGLALSVHTAVGGNRRSLDGCLTLA